MFDNETSLTGNILGTLFLAGMFWLTHESGKQAAVKEAEEKRQKEEIERLKRKVYNY